ncbi:phosphoribosylanthranilate isomerase [Flavobacterium gelidilacus]|uniref:phosphoribosylanthranilate isomerase n=2 Tax=Flavobacterium gelidilacus TaxID=206041 RepID=UPI00041D2FCA|nr:phosphoribosylanthranilate isomerase [Flavobacterium gelidilacus]
MKNTKLKICGMKYLENIQEIASLKPDYLGFIFWDESSRKFDLKELPKIESSIKKVGVFVDETLKEIQNKIETFKLDVIQLHGKESAEFCGNLKNEKIEIIKAFSIDNDFDFSRLKAYENVVDCFLFDTKGKLPGGNGTTFDWQVLENYNLEKPFFLSGGIGLSETNKIQEFLSSNLSKYCYAIDINSRFETEPGLKNKIEIEKFKKLLYEN